MINEANDLNKVVSAFTVYKFIKLISSPFTSMDAYKHKIIDARGKFIRDLDTLDPVERKSVDVFNRLIINLKKIIDKIPDPKLKAQLKTFPTAMVLLRDEAEKVGGDGDYVLAEITEYLNSVGVDMDNIELNWLFDTEIGENNVE
tara:strand:- start:1213 stop:1647 length:435 start_codon:yes stop_codon:yes gene_type:complete